MKTSTIYSSLLAFLLLITNSVLGQKVKPNSLTEGVQIGVITYSFRSMPSEITDLITYCQEAGISAVELMGDPAEAYAGAPQNPVKKRRGLSEAEKMLRETYAVELANWRATASLKPYKKIKKLFKKAGISIYAYKPRAFSPANTDAEITHAMKAAKILGATSVTLEMPKDNPEHTLRLGKLGEANDMLVGYHAHTQATDVLWDEALSQSPNNTLNLDIGHYIAAGGKNTRVSLLALIEAKHSRISSIHCKDRTTPANGAKNLVWGEGNTPIAEVLHLIRDNEYGIPVSIELEYQIPEGSDAVKEVKRSLEYAKTVLRKY